MADKCGFRCDVGLAARAPAGRQNQALSVFLERPLLSPRSVVEAAAQQLHFGPGRP
jgi:hypothetical protein